MNRLKSFLAIVLFIIPGICFCQTISLSSKGLSINSLPITTQMTIQSVTKILGMYSKKTPSDGIINYGFVDKGIVVYVNSSTSKIVGINLMLRSENYQGSLENFSGKFLISGFDIDKYTPIPSIKHIPNVEVQLEAVGAWKGVDASIGATYLNFEYNRRTEALNELSRVIIYMDYNFFKTLWEKDSE